jgi:hypothetical protein
VTSGRLLLIVKQKCLGTYHQEECVSHSVHAVRPLCLLSDLT